ncbi:MAG TPA: hypothetical protein EYG50_00480 [Cycloclasticus sp.]|jgi:hypothetical protein|nr:hypothetical protein [Cycloclasticus sp.]HIL91219.1 hypothetical protein [Cycloclasticus sp.]
MKRQGRLSILLFALFFYAPSIYAHGGLTIDQDKCVFRVARTVVHFTAYQPEVSQEEELCKDIPAGNNTIFVVDFVGEKLRKKPIQLSVEQKTNNRYESYLSKVSQIYPSGTTNLNLPNLGSGEYRISLLFNGPDDASAHTEGYFYITVTASNKEDSMLGLFDKYSWLLILASIGFVAYLLSARLKS